MDLSNKKSKDRIQIATIMMILIGCHKNYIHLNCKSLRIVIRAPDQTNNK